jgi:hypothetical protein
MDSIQTSLAQNTSHTKGKVNIYEYQNLVTNNDWTNAIQTALNNMTNGGTLYFPEGHYNHTGFTIPANYICILGSGRFSTFLSNTSSNNAITIATSSERGSFKEIAINGNGSLLYGSDATSGHGIVFSNNSISWNFENVTVRGHGGDAFHGGDLGNVNNINILNSEIEMNKGNGIYFVAKAGTSQINAINIQGCNVSNNGGSGFALWGNNINIEGNTVQGNQQYGYNINSDLVTGTGVLSCDMIAIKQNYSEAQLLGLLNIKVDYVASPVTYKYIGTLIFEENYGNENSLGASATALITITNGSGVSNLFNRAFKSFVYSRNSIATSKNGVNIFNGNNLIDGNSILILNLETPSSFVNYGHAQFVKKEKTKVLNNYLEAKGGTFTDITTGKSASITSNTTIYYPLKVDNYNGWLEIGVPVDTDYTNLQIFVSLYGRASGSKSAYTLMETIYLTSITNGIMKVQTSDAVSIFTYDDMYMQMVVYPTGGGGTGTYLYIYNPYIVFD